MQSRDARCRCKTSASERRMAPRLALQHTHRPAGRGGRRARHRARRHLRRRHLRPRRPLAALLARLSAEGRLMAFDRDPRGDRRRDHRRHAGRRPALLHPSRQLRPDARDAGRARHRARRRRAARPRRLVAADRRPRARLQLPLRRPAGHAHGPDPRRERGGFPGPRRRAPHRGGDPRLWGRTVCCTDCKGACCSARERAPGSNHTASCPTSWLVRSRPASRARTLQRARFRLFGFSSTPSLRSSNKA